MSCPVWARGLKQAGKNAFPGVLVVVPRVGTWIETGVYPGKRERQTVVPRVGTWIETLSESMFLNSYKVVPRVGTWIETMISIAWRMISASRAPCGHVD